MDEAQQTTTEEPAIVPVPFGQEPDPAEAPEDETGEPQEGGETTEAPVEATEEAKPYYTFRGRDYKTEADFQRAFEEAQNLIDRQGNELGQARQTTRPQDQGGNPAYGGQTAADPMKLATYLERPPAALMGDQSFLDYASRDLGIQWNTDDEGYIDTRDPLNNTNLMYARDQINRQVQTFEAQAYQQQQQQQQLETEIVGSLTSINPQLMDPANQPLTEAVAQHLIVEIQQGRRQFTTPADFAREVADGVTQAAARIMGNRGGVAAAAARQAPPPAPIAGGTTGRGAGGGTAVSTFEDLSDWSR
jgi:hypothetical protein